MHLITERLQLTPFDPGRDWHDVVRYLVLDPVVTRDWADFADPDLSDADKERLAADELLPWFAEGRAQGLVVWVLRASDGAFVGVSGLMLAEPPFAGPAPEFGCLLASRWHGQGLATEAGQAVLADGWERLGLAQVITVLDAPNPVNRRFVEKLGFRETGHVVGDEGQTYLRYVLERPGMTPE